MEKKEKARVFPGYGPDGSDRWAIVDTESGALIDDAGGCGYRSAGKAYAGWSWKKKERKRREEEERKKKLVSGWVVNAGILSMLLDTEKRIKRLGLSERMDESFFAELLEAMDTGIDLLPFELSDLVKWWKSGNKFSGG